MKIIVAPRWVGLAVFEPWHIADMVWGSIRRTGGRVLAPGVIADDQLAHLRGLGIRLAQGPLLAPPGWQPGEHVPVPVAAHSDPALGPRVT
jgi:EAL domain-containing protein (putative c-di-GMP-specific phosphodiesterase class I)